MRTLHHVKRSGAVNKTQTVWRIDDSDETLIGTPMAKKDEH